MREQNESLEDYKKRQYTELDQWKKETKELLKNVKEEGDYVIVTKGNLKKIMDHFDKKYSEMTDDYIAVLREQFELKNKLRNLKLLKSSKIYDPMKDVL